MRAYRHTIIRVKPVSAWLGEKTKQPKHHDQSKGNSEKPQNKTSRHKISSLSNVKFESSIFTDQLRLSLKPQCLCHQRSNTEIKGRNEFLPGNFVGKDRQLSIETCVECFLSSAKKIVREHLFFLLRNCTVKRESYWLLSNLAALLTFFIVVNRCHGAAVAERNIF